MTFKPIPLLIAYDPAGGRCGMVVPRMKQLLEERAFKVDVVELNGSPVDIEAYTGIVIGTPVKGLALRNVQPTAPVVDFIRDAEGLDEKKVALFCVYDVREGDIFDRLKNLISERGAEYVAEYAYWRFRPHQGEELLPAECMVRIR